MPLEATVITNVLRFFGCNSMSVIAREGISMLDKLCDQVRPPSRVRKIPPPVVPTKINPSRSGEIAMDEIAVPSNVREIGFQFLPLFFVRHSRVDPAQIVFAPGLVVGSIAITVNSRRWISSAVMSRGAM